MANDLSIREVARRTGLTPHTLRYYERVGLIAPILRSNARQRVYAESDVAWIEFLIRLRATRMPVRDMQIFARLRSEGDVTAAERREILQLHLNKLKKEIDLLSQSVGVIEGKIKYYQNLERSVTNL